MSQPHSLTWGDIRLAGDTVDPDAEFVLEAMADGTKLGTAKALTEFVKSLQVDGSLAVMNDHDNAETVIRLKVSAPEGKAAGPAVAKAAAALAANASADPIPPLVWVSPLEGAATCVYDVYAADPVRDEGDGWDLDEEMRECRFFTVTMSRHPFSRPPDPVTVPALPVPTPTETKVDIDTCDATTNWSYAAAGFGPTTKKQLATNPSFETNTTGWSAGTNTSSISRISSEHAVGAWCLYADVVYTGAAKTFYANGPTIPVVAGTKYLVQMRLSTGNPQAMTMGVLVRYLNGSGVQIGADLPATRSAAAWATVSLTTTAPAGAVSMRIYSTAAEPAGAALPMLVDGVYVTVADDALPYFDGATADTAQWDYSWDGTAHASTSTATAKILATTFGASGGQVGVTARASLNSSPARSVSLTRAAAVNMSTSPYLRVTAAVTLTGGTAAAPVFKIGTGTPTPVSPIAAVPSTISGYNDYYFAVTGTFDRFTIEVTADGGNTNLPTITISVAHIARTDLIVTPNTARQQARTATIIGSAPTQAAIRLYDATPAPLGTDIVVYSTSDDDSSPSLRPSLTSGGATGDTAMISGARNTLASPAVFRIPSARVVRGMYALVGRLNVTTAGTLTWSARVVDSTGAATVGSSIIDSGSIEVPVTSGYRMINLAAMLLPTVEIEGNQLVEITITGTANMTWDDFWRFNLTEGSLTWVRDADNLTWIDIRPPELGKLPSIFGGTGAFGTNPACIDYKTIGADFGAADQHYAEPGLIQVHTICSTSLKAQSDLWFYPRYLDAVLDETA
ncbi:hypothetical protein ACFJIY_25140 [Pimelobacter simplex]|uniref:hypothetical protein n=1 Tax=Nocardioides simplex TaxID=2045 RepID=UPI00366AE52A